MNKKVCHITSAHGRYDIRIFIKECVSLAKNGYDATLIVNDNNPDEVKEGVKIVSTKFKPKNRIERFLNSKKLLFSKALEVNADIYHLHDPDLLPLGNKLKRKGKKVIFDSHEDVPRQIKDKQWIPKIIRNIISKTYEIYEESSIKKYDAVISVTPHIVERFSGINPNSVMVTNYPIIDVSEEIARNPYKAICFAGGITEQYNHHKILMAIEDIENIKYLLAGNPDNQYLKKLKTLPAWEKVEYKGMISHSEVKKLYSQSIAGMAIHYSTQAKEQGSLGVIKLFEFMEAKLPVICSDYKLWKEIVEKYNCGICVDVNNVVEIKNAINYIINNPEEARVMGENGRKAVIEKYNWKTQEEILLRLYKKLWYGTGYHPSSVERLQTDYVRKLFLRRSSRGKK